MSLFSHQRDVDMNLQQSHSKSEETFFDVRTCFLNKETKQQTNKLAS
jgi:hypothetical protein